MVTWWEGPIPLKNPVRAKKGVALQVWRIYPEPKGPKYIMAIYPQNLNNEPYYKNLQEYDYCMMDP